MKRRRELLIALGAMSFTPRTVFAQAKQPIVIGWLSFGFRGGRSLEAFKEGLSSLGWKEGAQFVIEGRWAEGRDDRLAALTQ